jgi:hypothetical protein
METRSYPGSFAGAGHFEGRQFALRTALERVERIVGVLVGSRDRSPGIGPNGVCPVVVSRLGVRTRSLNRDHARLLRVDHWTQVQCAQKDI